MCINGQIAHVSQTVFRMVIIVVILALQPFSLWADDDPRKQIAKESFAKGTELAANEQFLEAAAAFETAYAINPHQAVLANIALCYDEGGNVVKAVETYRAYLQNPLDNQPNAKMRSRLAELEKQVGEVDVTCSETECTVVIDGASKQVDTGIFVVLPGSHLVEGTVDGAVIATEQVTLKAGARATVRLKAAPVMPAAVPMEPTDGEHPEETVAPVEETVTPGEPGNAQVDESGAKLRAPFWVFTGLAVAGGIAAASLGAATQKQHEDFLDSDRTDEGLLEKGENLKTATNVMIGVAGGAAVMAVIFMIVDLSREEKHPQTSRVGIGTGPGLGAGFHVQF